LGEIYRSLLSTSESLRLENVLDWDEIVELIKLELVTAPEVGEIFTSVRRTVPAGNDFVEGGGGIDLDGFRDFNAKIDQIIEDRVVEGKSRQQQQQQQQQEQQQDGDEVEKMAKEVDSIYETSDDTNVAPLSNSDDPSTTLLSFLRTSSTTLDPTCSNSSPQFHSDVASLIKNVEDHPGYSPDSITQEGMKGTWELLYTTSSLFAFHNGLTGLSNTFPQGTFKSLRQTLTHSAYDSSLIYTETIGTVFDREIIAYVKGSWGLKKSKSMLTGLNRLTFVCDPDTVEYMGTTTKADHWKSVRSINVLDVTSAGGEVWVGRGETSRETVFVWGRVG